MRSEDLNNFYKKLSSSKIKQASDFNIQYETASGEVTESIITANTQEEAINQLKQVLSADIGLNKVISVQEVPSSEQY